MRNAAAIVCAKRVLLECESRGSCLVSCFAALGQAVEHALGVWSEDVSIVCGCYRRVLCEPVDLFN
jgi:hypothetical protein